MTVAVLVKGYPRLSETFIVRELLGLEARGVRLLIVSLRQPTDPAVHDLHRAVRAGLLYLPEYLHQEPLRVLRGLCRALWLPGFGAALGAWLADLRRDRTANRGRRFGQALVLAAELPPEVASLYVHYLHTPGSVGRYTALIRGLPFALSAHAKDIWTTPAWEKRDKLTAARWTVTCARANLDHLRELAPLARIDLVHHGVDAARLCPPVRAARPPSADRPLQILTIARAVEKKGIDTLVEALGRLDPELPWRCVHVGDGPLRKAWQARAAALGIAERMVWQGAVPREQVARLLAAADLFCLPARIAGDGDRDGLPNVLLEALCMELAVVTTPVAAIPELIEHGRNGVLVPPDDPATLAAAIAALAVDPQRRLALGRAGRADVLAGFDAERGYDLLAERLLGRPLLKAAA
jgi:colanic acid/amylovoran biosynthesis glycosyltransferase